MNDSLNGRVALVTGAARGQGRSHAAALALAGADVVACDLATDLSTVPYALSTVEDLEETARAIREAGRRCLNLVADVRDPRAMEELVARGAAELGPIDIVCANAGVISFGRSWELTDRQWEEVLDTNLKGAWATCRAAIPRMIAARRGAIVLTTSAAGLKGYGGMSHYSASKHGLIGLARSLAIELAPYGVRVNCVAPGGVRTPMGTNEAIQGHLAGEPEAARALTSLLPEVDLVEPEDVSAAVVWLVSDAARYVTGAVLPVDGGVGLR